MQTTAAQRIVTVHIQTNHIIHIQRSVLKLLKIHPLERQQVRSSQSQTIETGRKLLGQNCHDASLFDTRCQLGQPQLERFTRVVVALSHQSQLGHAVTVSSGLSQVRRWIRNSKVTAEKNPSLGFLYPCPKCQMGQELWYTHFPSPYGCCHYPPGGFYLPEEPLTPPCPREKSKGCKVRRAVLSPSITI